MDEATVDRLLEKWDQAARAKVDRLLGEWAAAHSEAAGNAEMMCGSDPDVALCSERMARLSGAWNRVVEHALAQPNKAGDDTLPQPLRDFLAANAASACASCWLSSARPVPHPECGEKISAYFEREERLYEYALGALPRLPRG